MCHGKGTFYFASGAVYEGDWSNNQYHGRGTFTFPNGSKYEVRRGRQRGWFDLRGALGHFFSLAWLLVLELACV
jgi:hypothetical protein